VRVQEAQEEAPRWVRQAAIRRPRRRRRGSRAERGPAQQGLDTLFGAEEEFDYTSTTSPTPTAAGETVSSNSCDGFAFESWEGRPRGALLMSAAATLAFSAGRPAYGCEAMEATAPATAARDRGRQGAADRRGDAPRAWPGAGSRARPSTTSRARRACRAACCITTSRPRSGCWPRSCAATASLRMVALAEQARAGARRRRRQSMHSWPP